MLKLTWQKDIGSLWFELISLVTGTRGGLLWTRWRTFCSTKRGSLFDRGTVSFRRRTVLWSWLLLRAALFWVITQPVVVISYRCFWTTYRVPFFAPFYPWPLKKGPIGRLETSVRNYHYWLRSDPEERSSYLLRGRILYHVELLILVINQLDAQNLFYNKFISCLYMFRAPCVHRQEVKIVLYSLWYHHAETSELSKITKITKITKIYKMST